MNLINNYKEVLRTISSIKDDYSNKITLVAVSKTKPAKDILTLYNCGHRDFGENKVQELVKKIEELPNDINWHFIGHLQTNKVKDIVGKVFLIHSVDSKHLADKINSESIKKNTISNILLQINLSRDENKSGFYIEELYDSLHYISNLSNIKIKGIMLIPKLGLSNEELLTLFSQFFALKLDIIEKNLDNVSIEYLSFGMSNDYEIAIKCGSNMIRVGSSIFGRRE